MIENMVLAATDLGIDSLFRAAATAAIAQSTAIREKLEIPDGFKPVLCTFFGDASEKVPPKEHSISANRL